MQNIAFINTIIFQQNIFLGNKASKSGLKRRNARFPDLAPSVHQEVHQHGNDSQQQL